MNLSWVIVAASALSLLLIVLLIAKRRRTGGDLDQLTAQLRPIDINAFLTLIDEGELQYLRDRLPAREFRSIHRERMLAAAEYAWAAGQNARILGRMGEAAKRDPDPTVAATAESVQTRALTTRLYAFQLIPRLLLSAMFPNLHRTPDFVAAAYEALTLHFRLLVRSQSSTRVRAQAA